MIKNKKVFLICVIVIGILVTIPALLYFRYQHVMSENGFQQESISICVGEERSLPLKKPLKGYTWSTTNVDIVEVEAGEVIAKSQGTAVITASKYWYSFTIEINVLDHEVVPSTCEMPSVCAHCGEEFEPALGHSFTKATCTENSICKRCGITGENAYGHDCDEATCESASVCRTCSQVIAAPLGHEMLEANCEEPAKCTRCDYSEGDALGHVEPQKIDCEQDRICERCGEIYVKAGEHQYRDATCTKPKKCKICGKTEGNKLGHTYTQATCTQKAKCINCGVEQGSFASHYYVNVEGNRKICAYCGVEKGSYSGGQSSTDTNNNNTNVDISAWGNRVLEIINEERAKEGLGPLVMDSGLVNVATIRANEIIQTFSHTRPNGSSCFTAYDECGVSYSAAGENIAAGQSSPEAVMTAWMNSPGHRANIMSASFGRVGVGVVSSSSGIYGYYWVQNFAN